MYTSSFIILCTELVLALLKPWNDVTLSEETQFLPTRRRKPGIMNNYQGVYVVSRT